jgi:hypothetical protein
MKAYSKCVHVSFGAALSKGPSPTGNLAVPVFAYEESRLHRLALLTLALGIGANTSLPEGETPSFQSAEKQHTECANRKHAGRNLLRYSSMQFQPPVSRHSHKS